jgi:hypothetical protein
MKPSKHQLLFIFFLALSPFASAQFGPLGYDFGDPYVEFEGLRFALRLSTENNIYGPEAGKLTIDRSLPGTLILKSSGLSAAGGQLNAPGELELRITSQGNRQFSIGAHGSHPEENCLTLVILIKGIQADTFVSEYPQAKGIHPFSGEGGFQYSYPSRAATMPLSFISTPDGEWFVLSRDREIRRKGFGCYQDYLSGEPVVVLSHDEDTRKLARSITAPEWELGFGRNRQEIVMQRCRDLEAHFGLVPWTEKKNTRWIDSLKVVAFFHGVHWTGHMYNTFDQMGEQLEWICESMDGRQLMAFLPAWDGRYYTTYPEHLPDARMGGTEGLLRFVETAHRLGVKVVLMLGGPNLATFDFLEKHQMTDAALKGPDGLPQVQNWLDWNADLAKETMGLIMNFGHPKYLDHMIGKTAELFDLYGVDGVFLDGTLRWENAPDYSPYEGLVQYTREIRTRYPEKLIMGEDGYDAIYGLFDMFHTSGGPLGLENFILRYTRQFYYLSYPAENGSAGIHEIGWSDSSPTIRKAHPEYTIPSVSMLNGILDRHEDAIREKLSEYQKWKLRQCSIMMNSAKFEKK